MALHQVSAQQLYGLNLLLAITRDLDGFEREVAMRVYTEEMREVMHTMRIVALGVLASMDGVELSYLCDNPFGERTYATFSEAGIRDGTFLTPTLLPCWLLAVMADLKITTLTVDA